MDREDIIDLLTSCEYDIAQAIESLARIDSTDPKTQRENRIKLIFGFHALGEKLIRAEIESYNYMKRGEERDGM